MFGWSALRAKKNPRHRGRKIKEEETRKNKIVKYMEKEETWKKKEGKKHRKIKS
jgi:hypothetical protein